MKNPQAYILDQLKKLQAIPLSAFNQLSDTEMTEAVYASLMSKKFRKYSVPEKNQKIIKDAIAKNVASGEPIKISWPFGGYKLWRLEESPEPDWAELFTIMHIVNWLKPVSALYAPGVTFTFWVDEVVISMMNNVPEEDLDTYQKNFANLLKFIEPKIPANIRFEVFLERSQYESQEAFVSLLQAEMGTLQQIRERERYSLSPSAKRSIEMNVRTSLEQLRDPLWMEKVDLMHYAYYNLQEKQNRVRPTYASENITAFSVFFEPNVIPIGTTKNSIAKFWVGVGILEHRKDSYLETILSPSQIEQVPTKWEPVTIAGLTGKNFSRIRVALE
jgi:hypothetical protein